MKDEGGCLVGCSPCDRMKVGPGEVEVDADDGGGGENSLVDLGSSCSGELVYPACVDVVRIEVESVG